MDKLHPSIPDDVARGIDVSDDYLTSLNKVVKPHEHVLLVTSKGFVSRGLVATIRTQLQCATLSIVDDVTANPEMAFIDAIYAKFVDRGIKHIVALGGGSVMDTAKVLSSLLDKKYLSVTELLATPTEGRQNVRLTTIPTTSGTGAEITPFATVWDSYNSKKYSVTNVHADFIILCPSLTRDLPKSETMNTALDALSHALESLWNVNRSEQSAMYAKEAITLICDALPKALNDGHDLSARKALQQAALLSGLAISITKTALAHAISYPITLAFNVPHGLACSFTLVPLLKYVGARPLELSEEQADKVIHLLDSLKLHDVMNEYALLPDLLTAVDRELDPSRAGNFISPVTPELVKTVIEESMQNADT
ncbi:iron-containing alcohol dehydrogenase [Alteromonas sp. KUL42]|uniref:phosphonoacetaldehyde reductase n=1 Tax=Alteromonas sp. KUL42 TaxID=2480797 RepID=UPI00103672AE|nr:phosphonoacetaldehyde reductase [Alteromonas sp. KUL42]TAP37582.1 iron-containing alcohol dehydrogenase [Alteromonas sp. KUL42]